MIDWVVFVVSLRGVIISLWVGVISWRVRGGATWEWVVLTWRLVIDTWKLVICT
ncbi:hypothetical protein MNB_SUP05-SYMBIONT-5-237 [hydrothermal vent metagenome]|uniref:Uncharacterized protein n=1 Tax=hydrothermal vent metagenome TaxID=652676 RepID=A0A1W1E6L6_9ZZZZ